VTGTPRHSVSVSAVVTDERGRVLTVRRRDNGRWEIPGGVLELDEPVPDGVRREVAEETGLDVEPLRLTGVYKNMTLGVVALVFRARATGGALRTTEESAEVAWLDPGEVERRLPEVFAVRVRDALAGNPPAGGGTAGSAPAVRAHDGVRLLGAPPVAT
jgi:ADP-ribose pyrophosphatase YjhB (NUDIX family)